MACDDCGIAGTLDCKERVCAPIEPTVVAVSGIVVHAESRTAVDGRSFKGVALGGSERFLRRLRQLTSFFIGQFDQQRLLPRLMSVTVVMIFLPRR